VDYDERPARYCRRGGFCYSAGTSPVSDNNPTGISSHVTSTNMRLMAKLESGIRLIEENRVMEHLMRDVELVIGRPRLRLNTQVLQVYTHLKVIKTSELVQEMTGNNRSKKYARANQVQIRLVLCACVISDLASLWNAVHSPRLAF
jgi:hypothetical protein